ncbi:MAG: hypothetical protein IPH84_02140 [Bacteroidales bacterium]|nr:hypothetical protein [Bacteroidales bacterium]
MKRCRIWLSYNFESPMTAELYDSSAVLFILMLGSFAFANLLRMSYAERRNCSTGWRIANLHRFSK